MGAMIPEQRPEQQQRFGFQFTLFDCENKKAGGGIKKKESGLVQV